MSQKIEVDGEEVEVYTADEVKAQVDAAAKAKDDEYTPKLAEVTGKLTEAEKAAAQRAGEFTQFRKLSEEQVAALAEKDRIIYQNSLALKEAQDARDTSEKAAHQTAIANVIKAKAGTNADLQKRMEEMWPLMTVDATTPEQLEQKALMVLGAISTQAPNLVATVAGFTGAYAPQSGDDDKDKNFADTERGKAAAESLGFLTEAPKKA